MEEKTYLDQLIDLGWTFGPKVLTAFALLFGGFWVIKRLTQGFDAFLRRRHVDESLRPFFTSLADTGMKVILIFMVADTVGIETTSFIAVFTAVAFSVGLALQGSLGNFASGVLILLFRPYKVGDLLTVEDTMGFVSEIQIFSTVLTTEHGKKIIVPNSKMTEGPIEKAAKGESVQVEIAILLDSENDVAAIREATDAAAARCPWRLADMDTEVAITGLSRDDMKAEIGWWTLGENYIKTFDYMHEALREEFAARGVKVAKERRRESI
ncbi:MAG: mechanosensitive ion channel family protein [Saprospiraceae bacterium]|nr:mechanosensitive ion channel family protein [Saprospiraceae bacterium]